MKWYVDASYTMHYDCRDCTGALMTLGGGAVASFSQKQKINAKNSIEMELIGIDEALHHELWTLNFLEEQGYAIENNILYQDNESAMIMETNGKNINSKWMKHIMVRYFFIKDQLNQKEIELKDCSQNHYRDLCSKQ